MLNSKPRRSTNVEWYEKEGIILIFDAKEVKLYVLRKGPAKDIWNWSDGKTTLNQIIRRITEKYYVDEKQAERDTIEFIKRLVEKSLVDISS